MRVSGTFRLICLALCFALVGPLAASRAARGYTPDSPEVTAMINRAIKFMEANYATDTKGVPHLGGICISALALMKNGTPEGHPMIVKAVEHCKESCKKGVPWEDNNYSVGIAIIFLCELDPEQYRPEIDALVAGMLKRQMPGGGWSYQNYQTGDTSQTQYSVLAMWIAHRSGISVDLERVAAVCNWLIRTQAPNGSWGYQGKDPGPGGAKLEQERTTPTMAAAALASLFICGELLGYIVPPPQQVGDLPPAVREAQEIKKVPVSTRVDQGQFQQAIAAGMRWFSANSPVQVDSQQHYYMYSLERFHAFRELAEGKYEKEPAWYNNGVQFLQRTQAKEGYWHDRTEQGPVVDSAFAVLFLLRAAKKSIAKIVLEQGVMIAGKELPKDLSQVQVTSTGKVVDLQMSGQVEDVLKLLEDPDSPQSDFLNVPEELVLEKDPAKRAQQIERLRRLAANGSFQARLTAVKTLSLDRDLANVPVLIYALSDPNPAIIREARHGLRFISRKFDGYGPPDDPTDQQKRDAQKRWAEWFKSIKPDGELLE